ncbi:type IA DNA topoisomerase [Lactiplantibacillus plantarum]|nr:type IA DNA topoisomerase [Lactiplantibacillus plantarum]
MQTKRVQKGSQDGLIKDVQKQDKKRASPQLFSLSSLQSAMNKRYHGSAAIKQQIDHQQQAQKAAEVFLETPQATVLNKQKFYIVKPKQGEDFTLPKKWSSKTLGKTAIKALVTKGETSKLKSFKSKKGKSFDAKLKLDGHKLSFDFD